MNMLVSYIVDVLNCSASILTERSVASADTSNQPQTPTESRPNRPVQSCEIMVPGFHLSALVSSCVKLKNTKGWKASFADIRERLFLISFMLVLLRSSTCQSETRQRSSYWSPWSLVQASLDSKDVEQSLSISHPKSNWRQPTSETSDKCGGARCIGR